MLLTEKLKQSELYSNNEQIIASYILEQGIEIKDQSSRQVASTTYTSPATVVRLCQKLGMSGFDEFKEKYLEELNYLTKSFNNIDVNYPFSKEDTADKIANKISTLHLETIQDTMQLLNHDNLQHANRIIEKAKNIYIFSLGSSINVGLLFKEKMMKIKNQVIISEKLEHQIFNAYSINEQDCAIILSYSGENKGAISIAEILKQRHIPFISLTSFGDNPINEMSDCALFISTREIPGQNTGNMVSNVSFSLILDILYSCYYAKNYQQNLNFTDEVNTHIEQMKTMNKENS